MLVKFRLANIFVGLANIFGSLTNFLPTLTNILSFINTKIFQNKTFKFHMLTNPTKGVRIF